MHVRLTNNTHDYDGKLNPSHLESLSSVHNLSIEEKKRIGNDFVNYVSDKISPSALHYLRMIVTNMGTVSNIDNTNNLVADDLIYLCWDRRTNKDFLATLEIQLIDMATGFCPQGRTHRLFQSLLAFPN